MTQHHPRSLQALILDKKGERSYERLSRDCGGLPTRNALHRLVTNRMKAFPDKETLLGLQRGLPSTVDELLGACAISMGLKDDSADPDNLLIRGAGVLPASSQQLLISLSTEMQRLAEERGGDADAAPITRAGESPVDMDEFKARRQRISAAEGTGDLPTAGEHDGELEAPEGAVARRNAKAKKEADDDWENV